MDRPVTKRKIDWLLILAAALFLAGAIAGTC